MAKIKINFGDAAGSNLVAEGLQPIIVEDIKINQAEGKDYPYLDWSLDILSGEFEGRKLSSRTSLAPKALFRLYDDVEALGLIPEDFDPVGTDVDVVYDEETGVVSALLFGKTEVVPVGCTAYAEVYHEQYNHRLTAHVNCLRPIDEGLPARTVNVPAPQTIVAEQPAKEGESQPQARRISLK